ncbi:hypothetical protein B5S50_12815 [Clostridium sp. 001]|nr:hypothetical protein B5S50_12815 [Clostridium sp. 001]
MSELKRNKIFVSGYAKLPGGITATEVYTEIAMTAVLDRVTGEIYEIECTLVTNTAREYIKKLLAGRNINDIDDMVKDIADNYFGIAKKAIIASLTNCYERYILITKSGNEDK